MLVQLWQMLLRLIPWLMPAAIALPGDHVKLPEFELDWVERHASLLYPLAAVGTLALVGWAVVSALFAVRIPVELRLEYKREIITLLRKEIAGASEERMAQVLALSAKKTALLAGELERDGVIARAGKSGGKGTVWRMRIFVDQG